MDMEELNKTQLILLALLVSFVTSIATGIVTVTLMDQAPPGVTQMINRVVEKTIQVSGPEGETKIVTQETIVLEGDRIKTLVQDSVPSMVVFYLEDENGIHDVRNGFVVSSDGIVATDPSVVPLIEGGGIKARYAGMSYDVSLVGSNTDAACVRLTLASSSDESVPVEFKPLSLAQEGAVSLGSTIVGVDVAGDPEVLSGIVTRLERSVSGEGEEESVHRIHTDIGRPIDGGPILLLDGTVAGIGIGTGGALVASPASSIVTLMDARVQENQETESEVQGVSTSSGEVAPVLP